MVLIKYEKDRYVGAYLLKLFVITFTDQTAGGGGGGGVRVTVWRKGKALTAISE